MVFCGSQVYRAIEGGEEQSPGTAGLPQQTISTMIFVVQSHALMSVPDDLNHP